MNKKILAVGGLALAGLGVIFLLRKKKVTPPPPPPGYANLYGKVTDSVSGQAISGVLVALDSRQTNTDANGNYALANIPVGSYTATFSKAGYETAVF